VGTQGSRLKLLFIAKELLLALKKGKV